MNGHPSDELRRRHEIVDALYSIGRRSREHQPYSASGARRQLIVPSILSPGTGCRRLSWSRDHSSGKSLKGAEWTVFALEKDRVFSRFLNVAESSRSLSLIEGWDSELSRNIPMQRGAANAVLLEIRILWSLGTMAAVPS